ncbi:MAG: DUF4230 domain-containing protein [Acetatifactor sp.]|nr:DUF4230 domain-containing protein [Acetatifactor sp.]
MGKVSFKWIKWICILLVVGIVIFLVCHRFDGNQISKKAKERTVTVSASVLEKTLQISELSTYKITYNGVAAVRDSNEKILYNVAYDAKVSVGIDMEKIKIEVNEDDKDNKKIIVSIPQIEIMDADVDPGSLDYIFQNKNANTSDVFKTAYPACIEDAENECKNNHTLYKLARENAINMIKALMQPLLVQYEQYSLEIVCEGDYGYE